jgi:hypothetical protein
MTNQISRTVIVIVIALLLETNAKGMITEVFEHQYLVLSPAGLIGVGDWATGDYVVESTYVAPYHRTHVYFGPWEVYLRGHAILWLWTIPILLTLPWIVFFGLWLLFHITHRRLVQTWGYTLGGLYFGVLMTLFGYFDSDGGFFGSFSRVSSSPVTWIDFRIAPIYWLAVGLICARYTNRLAARILVICTGLHLVFLVAVLSGHFSQLHEVYQFLKSTSDHMLWLSISAILYGSAHIVICRWARRHWRDSLHSVSLF